MKRSCEKGNRYGKKWKHTIVVCILSMFFAMNLPLTAVGKQTPATRMLTQGSDNYAPVTYKVGDILVGVYIGLGNNMVQNERYAPVLVTIQNDGKDFSGSFRLYESLADDYTDSHQMIVEKNLQVAAGETKQYTMLMKREQIQENMVQTALCNSKGKVLGHKKVTASVANLHSDSLPTIGLISEDGTGLSYLKNDNYPRASMLYHMQDWMITDDWRSLDSFDIIVINDFDTSRFSKKQIAAMEEWVELGGTLIFGTGAQPEKSLKAFSSSLFQGTIGNVKQISLKEGGSLDISELKLEQAEVLLSQDQDTLVSKVTYGDGCVMVASFDLNIIQQEFAKKIQKLFYRNYSAVRRKQLRIEGEIQSNYQGMDTDYSSYAVYQGLSVTEVKGLPNIVLYAVLLVFYALLVGPILYSILRKKGKREQLWKLIPVLAVVFSVLIYLIGTSTRVRKPYINYLTQIDLSNAENLSAETFFKLTTPNNDSFDLEFSGKTDLAPYRSGGYLYWADDSGKTTEYQYGIEYLSDRTTLHMDNMGAFDSAVLQEKQRDTGKGKIEFSNLRLNSGNPDGIVSNNTNYDLEDCQIVFGNEVLSLGDMKQGESIALKDCPKKNWEALTSSWTDSIGRDIMGYDDKSDCQGYRRAILLERYGEVKDPSGYYFYGFLSKEQDTVFTKQFDLELYGETAVVQTLTEDDLKNNEKYFLGTLDQYILDLPSELDEATQTLNIADSALKDGYDIKVTYDLSSLGNPENLQLQYRRRGNSEFDFLENLGNDLYYSYANPMFFGTVAAVNQKSGKQKNLITNGQEAEIADLSQYLDKNGQLELTYHIEMPDSGSSVSDLLNYLDGGLQLPELILERRNAQ